jgi:hypothetical protein
MQKLNTLNNCSAVVVISGMIGKPSDTKRTGRQTARIGKRI